MARFAKSHATTPPYISTDPAVITRHILAAQAQCIDGFVVNWYGPISRTGDGGAEFIDQAFAELLQQSEIYKFKVAIIYDEGALRGVESLTQTHAISDLLYATSYFTSPAYLEIDDQPALFVFPYNDIDPWIDWRVVRQELSATVPVTVTLFTKDPTSGSTTRDANFDGFYAWVQPSGSGWEPDGSEWGEEYLRWF